MSGLSSLLKTQGDSPLIAVVPPDMLFRSDREYVIHKLHEEDCLSCMTILLRRESAEADCILPITVG